MKLWTVLHLNEIRKEHHQSKRRKGKVRYHVTSCDPPSSFAGSGGFISRCFMSERFHYNLVIGVDMTGQKITKFISIFRTKHSRETHFCHLKVDTQFKYLIQNIVVELILL